MRVLIFQTAVSAVALKAMTDVAEAVRREGHFVGVRNLAAFRREKEPADRIAVLLTPTEAGQYQSLGAELVQVFNDTDKFIAVELEPMDSDAWQDAEYPKSLAEQILSDLDDKQKTVMDFDQLKAECIERGLEVRADSTPAELAHLLDIDHSDGRQAGDRLTDRANMDPVIGDRVGLRTSTVLPNANGLDLERMNDEQLHATAAELGVSVPRTAKRETVINKITKVYAAKVQAPSDAAPQAPAESFDADLPTDEAGLRQVAETEGVDLGRTTSVDGMTAKIVEARQAKAQGNGGE